MGATAPFVDSTYGKLWAADYGYLGGSIYTGGPGQQGSAVLDDRSSRPGNFGVDVKPAKAGTYTMTVELRSRDLTDKHSLGNVTVYNDQASASKHPVEKKQEETIAFLREQQWSLEFATEVVSQRSERSGFEVPAEVQPRAGGQGQVTDPLDGRLAKRALHPSDSQCPRGCSGADCPTDDRFGGARLNPPYGVACGMISRGPDV